MYSSITDETKVRPGGDCDLIFEEWGEGDPVVGECRGLGTEDGGFHRAALERILLSRYCLSSHCSLHPGGRIGLCKSEVKGVVYTSEIPRLKKLIISSNISRRDFACFHNPLLLSSLP